MQHTIYFLIKIDKLLLVEIEAFKRYDTKILEAADVLCFSRFHQGNFIYNCNDYDSANGKMGT